MVGVTLGDIVLRLISRLPGDPPFGGLTPAAVPGVVDLVPAQPGDGAHKSIAVTFLLGTHVVVDVIPPACCPRACTSSPSRKLDVWLKLRLHGRLCFYGGGGAGARRNKEQRPEFTATISLPLWWFWIPVVLGTALAALACFGHFFGPGWLTGGRGPIAPCLRQSSAVLASSPPCS